jgi:hypothetical protein
MEEVLSGQHASLKLSDSLVWAFDAVSAKTENGIAVVKDLSEWLKKRAQVSATLLINLMNLYRSKPITQNK